jgi:hypothetical protein
MADSGIQKQDGKLFVIMARESKTAVIFRRGPSRWVQLIRWYTETDTLEPGQWFHGRIYDERCDLSPNGEHLIYFAAKHQNWRTKDKLVSWTAISRPPFLTAIAFWPNGDTTYGGGGFFDSNKKVRVQTYGGTPWQPNLVRTPSGIHVQYTDSYCEEFPLLVKRLERDGWIRCASDGQNFQFEKSSKSTGWVIALRWNPRDSDRPFSAWCRRRSNNEAVLDSTDWADFDKTGRLVFSRGRKLYCLDVGNGGVAERELADFSKNKPEEKPAPDWATHW